MKSEKFFEIFTDLDDDLIVNAVPDNREPETVHPAARSFTWKTFALSAAAVIAVFAAVFVGIKLIGSHRLNSNDPPVNAPANSSETQTSSDDTNSEVLRIAYWDMEADWITYSSADELIKENDIIVSGKVTGISFEMLDKKTATVVDANTKDSDAELCTIYHVDVITPYKGYSDKTLQIRMHGGLEGYEDDKQLELLRKHGCDMIYYLQNAPKIELGEEYLFVLAQFEGTLPTIINPAQTAFPLNDRTSKEKYSNASVNDIITRCCGVSVVHKGETLTLSPEQIEALYSLIFEAWSKVETTNDAVISEQFMKNYGEKGYCITSSSELSDLVVLIGEEENDTVIGKNSYTGLPEGYREKILDVLNGKTQQTPQNEVKVVHKGKTLTLTPEQNKALYSLMYEAESKVEIWMPATIAGMKEYGEKGYCITSNNGLVVLIGEDESDTLIGNGNLSGLPEGYYEKFMEILNGNTLQQDPQNKVTVVHEGETLLLTPEQSEALSEAVEQASFNDCGPLSELTRIISTQDMEEYGNNGYCITAEFSDYDVPQIKPGSDQRVNQIVDVVVLIGEEGKSSYITYNYIVYSASGVSEKRSGGTFFLSNGSREKILETLNSVSSSNTEPNTFFSTRSVTFEQAKERVSFIDVKEVSDPDFLGYELGYIMPSGTVANITYLFKYKTVTVYDNSVAAVDFTTENAEKIEHGEKVFWRPLGDDRLFYVSDSGAVYMAETKLLYEDGGIDVIITLIITLI